MTHFIRIGLNVALLAVVWMNAHWSVALSITLLSATAELVSLAFKFTRRRIESLERKVWPSR